MQSLFVEEVVKVEPEIGVEFEGAGLGDGCGVERAGHEQQDEEGQPWD